MIEILDEASQVRAYARALEDASAELREANEQLKSLDQMKDDFISAVSHELRTPLTSIRALAELMQDTPDIPPEQRDEFLGIIITESERLGRLVSQVLDMARIEAGMADWHVEEVDLRALVAAALKSTAELFRSRGVKVESSLPEAVPPVHGDADRLTQVMLNLLSNAAKFVPDDGRGRVEVRLRRGRTLVVGSPTTGRVPAAERATVFDKFRAATGDRPPGSNMGLPISRQIVEHLGVKIWLGRPKRGHVSDSACRCGGTEGGSMATVLIADDEHRRVPRVHDEAQGATRCWSRATAWRH